MTQMRNSAYTHVWRLKNHHNIEPEGQGIQLSTIKEQRSIPNPEKRGMGSFLQLLCALLGHPGSLRCPCW